LEIREAAREFAAARRSEGDSLVDDWLNNGPSSLIANLPEGWERRSQRIFDGHALTLPALGRIDFLMSKLFALCDRGIDLSDCIALAPTSGELREILPWLERQDANPDWPAHVRAVLDDLRRRLGDGL
jgi:hypothetical protein